MESMICLALLVLLIVALVKRVGAKRKRRPMTSSTSAEIHRQKDFGRVADREEIDRLREQNRFAQEAVRFYEQLLSGQGFEHETKDFLIGAVHLLPNVQIFSNVNSRAAEKGRFQLDLVLLSKERIYIIECKNWSAASAGNPKIETFINAAVFRLWSFSNDFYWNLRGRGCEPAITRIIVVKEKDEGSQKILEQFQRTINETADFEKVKSMYLKAVFLKDLEGELRGANWNESELNPKVLNAIQSMQSYEFEKRTRKS